MGVSIGCFWPVCHVSGKAFGGCQTRPLADQQDGNAGTQQISNLVENAHPAVTNHKDLAETPAASLCSFPQEWQESRNLRGNSGHREPVADYHLQVMPLGARSAKLWRG